MRILFAGTPDMAVPTLHALADAESVVGVLTAPDRSKGRGRRLLPSPVKAAAMERDVPVLQPPRLGAEAREAVRELEPEILVVVAYGRIFGPKFLSLFPRGGINLHPSLLPKYRGPSPIPAAILAGESRTGITVQRVAREMDSGDILRQEELPLSGTETTASLSDYVAREGAKLVLETVRDLAEGRAAPSPQDHDEASYCGLISKQDGEIDWSSSAARIERMTRAYNPWPGAYTFFGDQRLTIWRAEVLPAGPEAAGLAGAAAPGAAEGTNPGLVLGVDKARGILIQTGDGVLAAQRLQLQSRSAADWQSFLNGARDILNGTLGRH